MGDVVLAILLAAAGVLISIGAAMFHVGAGLIVGGLLLAGWSVLVMSEIPDRATGEVTE